MNGVSYQLVVFLMILMAAWVWGLVAVAAWRLRRQRARGRPGGADRDWLVQLALKGGGLLLLALCVVLLVRY